MCGKASTDGQMSLIFPLPWVGAAFSKISAAGTVLRSNSFMTPTGTPISEVVQPLAELKYSKEKTGSKTTSEQHKELTAPLPCTGKLHTKFLKSSFRPTDALCQYKVFVQKIPLLSNFLLILFNSLLWLLMKTYLEVLWVVRGIFATWFHMAFLFLSFVSILS